MAVNTIAYDEGETEEYLDGSHLRTDPSLPIVEEVIVDPEQKILIEKYSLTEPTLTNEQKTRLAKVLNSVSGVFAEGKLDLGECTLTQHKIDVGDHPPISSPPHSLPYHLRDTHRKELNDLLEQGIIEPTTSEWASPVVYVKKKDGTWRMCVDYRKLNLIARMCVYPLPKVNDIFTMMTGSRYFTTLDLAKGFWQIALHPDSKDKTAFNSVFGQYQFKRLPFGLSTAPSAFQNSLNSVLAGINWVKCMVYLDDILIFSKTFEEHLETVKTVCERLANANLKIGLPKCEFARTECNFLGHVLNSQGISPLPEKVSAVKDMPYPECTQQVETFLGKVGYYGRFIDHLATIAKPLFALKKKRVTWKFEDAEKQAFDLLKARLCTAPVLRHPDFERQFILSTDASGYGLGAVLSQEFDDGEHPISYASTTLQDEHTRYAVIEREGLALCWGISHFEEYLLGKPFVVYTDHKPLLSLLTKDQCNKRLQNYALKLQHFKFEIKYRKGSENSNADALSRNIRYPVDPCKGKRTKATQDNQDESGNWIIPETVSKKSIQTSKADKHVLSLHRPDTLGERRSVLRLWANIAELQGHDPSFANLRKTLKSTNLVQKKHNASADNFILDDQDILRKYVNGKPVVCLPEPLRASALATAHDTALAAHGGILKTYNRLRYFCWWPGMNGQAIQYVKNCPECLAFKPPPRNLREPMGTRPPPTRVFERVHMDVWSAGGQSDTGNTCVIAFIDALSKFVIAVPLPFHTTRILVDAFMHRVVIPFGMPEELVSDGAPEFRAFLKDHVFATTGVTRKVVTAYRPQANGQVERFFRTLKPMLAILARKRPKKWDVVLPYAIHAYNSAYNAMIDNTPFYLMFGRRPIGRIHDIQHSDHLDSSDSEQDNPLERLKAARAWAWTLAVRNQHNNKYYYDQKAKTASYKIDDNVYVKVEKKIGEVRKLVPKYVGPFVVTNVKGSVLYVVPKSFPNETPREVHADRTRPSHAVRDMNLTLQELQLPWRDPAQVDPNLEAEEVE